MGRTRERELILLAWEPKPIDGDLIPSSITANETIALRQLAAGKRILEIGSAYGYSTIIMALAGATHILAVDPHTGMLNWLAGDTLVPLRDNLRTHQVEDRVTIALNTSQNTMPALVDAGARYDLIFIDGDHSEQQVAHDLHWATRLLADNGTLAFHDYHEQYQPGVRKALDAAYPDGPDRLVDTLWIKQP